MSAIDPTQVRPVAVTTWSGSDNFDTADWTSVLTNGNTSLPNNLVGTGIYDTVLRCTYSGLSTLKAGDTITAWVASLSTYATMALLPHTSSSAVSATNKITLSAATGANVFTLTQAFIDDLVDLGSDTFRVRFVEDGGISGTAGFAEIDADLSTEGGSPGPPGSTPGNAPDNYEFLKDDRMTRIGAIGRMPTTQREWTNFIQELDKVIKTQTGTFDVGVSATAQFTGFSADPASSSIWWHRYGQLVHLEFNIGTGTSDATDFTITGIPEVIRPRDDCVYPFFGLTDSVIDTATSSSIKIGSDGTLTFYTDHEDGAWTASGTKGFTASIGVKGIIYSLRNPFKQ